MDYPTLSLLQLKQVARTRRIKQYYIMKRAQLIELLSLKELPQAVRVEKMTIHQLRDEARRKGLVGFWTLRRAALVELLFPDEENREVDETAPNKDEEDHGEADKHHQPQKHDSEEVGIKNV
jgi:hypothetical protein